jgi:Mrp family chromosome partitioning ATPase
MGGCSSDDTGCSSCSSASGCGTDEKQKHTEEMTKKKLSDIKYKIMVMSGKGGVGKSTVSVSLAVMLNAMGYTVGILDADIHGPNIPKMLGVNKKGASSNEDGIVPIEPIEGLKIMSVGFLIENDDDAIIWRAAVKHSMIQQFISDVSWGKLDFLIIDLPPGTGDEPLSVAHIIGKVDGSVIVTTPQDVALLDSRKSVTFSKKLGVPIYGIVENMSGFACPHCGENIDLFKSGGGEKAAAELEVNFLGKVPIETQVVQDGDAGTPHVLGHPGSQASKAMKEITLQILEQTVKA